MEKVHGNCRLGCEVMARLCGSIPLPKGSGQTARYGRFHHPIANRQIHMYSFTNIPFLSALQFELSFDCVAFIRRGLEQEMFYTTYSGRRSLYLLNLRVHRTCEQPSVVCRFCSFFFEILDAIFCLYYIPVLFTRWRHCPHRPSPLSRQFLHVPFMPINQNVRAAATRC